MLKLARRLAIDLTFISILAGAGCELNAPGPPTNPPNANSEPSSSNTNSSNTNSTPAANSNAATRPPAAAPSGFAPDLVVILPALNRLLSNQVFVDDIKTRLSLSGQQLDETRVIAREAALKLQRSASDENQTSDTARARKTAEKSGAALKMAIGEDRASELLAIVAERIHGDPTLGVNTSFSCGAPPDTRIVVNEPAFRMDVFENGQLVKSYSVGIGYPEYPLPIGLREVDTIIFNPSWTPPDSSWVEAYGKKVKVGETVKPGDTRNPLGVMKIPLGMAALIHGGKRPAQIGGFASHGCVGLTNAQARDFAKLIARLGGIDLDDEQIAKYEKAKTETETIKLNRKIPVELRYETITVEDGKLHVYRDVYTRYTNTEQNLGAVLGSCGLTLAQLPEPDRGQAMSALVEMSRDPQGRLISPEDLSGPGTDDVKSPKKRISKKPEVERVTRFLKGQKEVVLEIEALKGKGYPALAELDTGKNLRAKKTSPKRRIIR